MDALLPMRCDPAHFGHWLLIHDMLQRFQRVTVGIRDTKDDLFSTAERLEIAIAAFGKSKRLTVITIADIDRCETWQDLAAFDIVVTGNEQARQAAEKYYTVMDTPRHGDYSSTEIRRRLALNLGINDLAVPWTAWLIWRRYKDRYRSVTGGK